MDFSLTETQEIFKSTAKKFFEQKCTVEALQAFENEEDRYSESLYKELADLGFLGLVIPEKYGGFDGSLMDLALVLEEAGYATLPSPFLSTLSFGVFPILKYGTEEQKKKLLPAMASGEITITGALSEGHVHYDLKNVQSVAEKVDGGYVLNGTKAFVPFARSSQHMLTLARVKGQKGTKEELIIFLVETNKKDIAIDPLKSIGPGSLYEVSFNDTFVSNENIVGDLHYSLEVTKDILQQATALQCVKMVGVLRKALELTSSYVKERKQFNVPIGSFQSVKHRLADMYTIVEGGYLATFQSISLLEENLDADKKIATAKAWLSKEGQKVLVGAHQLHGGMGVEVDYPLQFCFRHFKHMQLTLGTAPYHLQQIGKNLAAEKEVNVIRS